MARGRSGRLKVLMNGELVGWLESTSKGLLTFIYDQSWLDHDERRSISLSLPLNSQKYSGILVENFFDNLLPDSQPIRNRLQARLGADSTKAYDLLSHIGRDCVGALQLVSEGQESDVHRIDAETLRDEEIEALLKGYMTAPLGVDPEADFRISVAGAQEKTALLYHQDGWCRPSRATPTSHIFKLPIGELGHTGIDLRESVENEWLCQRLLGVFGVPMAKVDIAQFGEQKVLVVERFDRRWSKDGSWLMRLPQEDMCQATGTANSQKYEAEGGPGVRAVMDILLGSERSQEDRELFMKSQLLFWMLGGIDGHGKNFSIFHLRGGLYRMTPLYDVISIYPVVSAKQVDIQRVKMAMAVLGSNRHYHWDRIVRRHWLESARNCRFDPISMESILQECCDIADDCIMKVKDMIPKGFPNHIADAIFTGLIRARNRLLKDTN